jgi:integrase/recombinase XerD
MFEVQDWNCAFLLKSEIMARRLPLFLKDREPEAILRATRRERDRILLLAGLYCGLRVSELCRLDVADLDFGRRILFVRQGKGKKDRMVPIPRKLLGPLRAWVNARNSGPVFPSSHGGCLTPRAVQLLVKRLAAAAGLPQAAQLRYATPHKLRHAYATRLLESGATIYEVRDLLGHSSIATTETYLHTTPERLSKAVDRI